jgi:hypothetical protein
MELLTKKKSLIMLQPGRHASVTGVTQRLSRSPFLRSSRRLWRQTRRQAKVFRAVKKILPDQRIFDGRLPPGLRRRRHQSGSARPPSGTESRCRRSLRRTASKPDRLFFELKKWLYTKKIENVRQVDALLSLSPLQPAVAKMPTRKESFSGDELKGLPVYEVVAGRPSW